MSLSRQRLTKTTTLSYLSKMGFDSGRINRALSLYEKYPIYNLAVIKEIIYRIIVKDKARELGIDPRAPKQDVIYYSRVNVKQALEAMTFHAYYIDLALKEYEARRPRVDHYDMQQLVAIVMQLRAKHPYPTQPVVQLSQSAEQQQTTEPVCDCDCDDNEVDLTVSDLRDTCMSISDAKRTATTHSKQRAVDDDDDEEAEHYDYYDDHDDDYPHCNTPRNSEVTDQSHQTSTLRLQAPQISHVSNLSHLSDLSQKLKMLSVDRNDDDDDDDANADQAQMTQSRSGSSRLHANAIITKLTVHGSSCGEFDVFNGYDDDDDADMASHSITPFGRQTSSHSRHERRECIEREIMATEKAYYYALKTLFHELLTPIFKNGCIAHKYYDRVTSCVAAMLEMHETLYREFCNGQKMQKFKHKKRPSVIAILSRVFCDAQHQKRFHDVYTHFIAHYNDVLDIIGRHHISNAKLSKFIAQKQRCREPKLLAHLLIMPFQRIPRYIASLDALRKCMNSSADTTHLERVLSVMQPIAHAIDIEQHRIEQMTDCLQVQLSLNGLKYSIIDRENRRRFEAQFVLLKHDGQRPRLWKFLRKYPFTHWFLLSDILIITNHKLMVKKMLSLKSIRIQRHEQAPHFTLITGVTSPTHYIAKTMEELDEIEAFIEGAYCCHAVWEDERSRFDSSNLSVPRHSIKGVGCVLADNFQ